MIRFLLVLLVLSAGCKQRQDNSGVAGNVVLDLRTPPTEVYHYGELQYLLPYGDRSQTFSEAEWQKIPSNSSMLPYRRGLYVSQHPAYNERYAGDLLTKERNASPWIMKLKISEECRMRHSSFGPMRLPQDPRFQAYLRNTQWSSMAHWQATCERADAYKHGAPENLCTQWVEAFYKASDIWITYDHLWPDSGFWQIRDRRCIEGVEASPESVLEMSAETPEYWGMSPYNTEKERDPDVFAYGPTQVQFLILVRALHEAKSIDSTLLRRIARNGSTSDLPFTRAVVQATVEQAAACSDKGQLQALRAQTEVFLEKAATPGAIGARGISFWEHMENFVRYGLTSLGSACGRFSFNLPSQPAPVAAPTPIPRPQPAAAAENWYQITFSSSGTILRLEILLLLLEARERPGLVCYRSTRSQAEMFCAGKSAGDEYFLRRIKAAEHYRTFGRINAPPRSWLQ